MSKLDVQEYLISHDETYKNFIRKIDVSKHKALFVVDESQKFLGTVTEGDLRRYVIANDKQPSFVHEFFNRNSVSVRENERNFDLVYEHDISKGAIPILGNDDTIVDIFTGDSVISKIMHGVKKPFTVIAPTRISFAGGGSDIGKWFKHHNGRTLNLAIKKYARVSLSPIDEKIINIHSCNTSETLHLKSGELECYSGKKLRLIVNCIKKFDIKSGINIQISCDFPPGTGLGGSSALTVAVIKALSHYTDTGLSADEIYKLAYDVERNDTCILGGWQDFIPATYGGLCYAKYKREGIFVQQIALDQSKNDFLSSALFLVKVGNSRSSSDLHAKISDEMKRTSYIRNMENIIGLVDESVDIIGRDNWAKLGSVLDKGWQYKKAMSAQITNKLIDDTYKQLTLAGATGGRLLGAGASGYLLMFVPLDRQVSFLRFCEDNKFNIERIHIDTHGVRLLGVS
jgi:D-glycero-alpha-D-manno-heptose-7-phosphate kinase